MLHLQTSSNVLFIVTRFQDRYEKRCFLKGNLYLKNLQVDSVKTHSLEGVRLCIKYQLLTEIYQKQQFQKTFLVFA